MIEQDPQLAERLMTPTAPVEERALEMTLRPRKLVDFVGQQALKDNLNVFLEAAKRRNEPLEHTLFYGNPGLGKTTLANVLATEMGAQIRVTSGPALERVGDLAAILSNMGKGDVLFIDEIHRMNHTIEEVLYPAMEDFNLEIIVGKGPTARTLRLDLEKFTIVGATTRLSLLSAPLRDRFGMVYHVDFYKDDEIADILRRNAAALGAELNDEATIEIARRARRTPRIANRLLRRVRDFAEVKGDGRITKAIAEEALAMLSIDQAGLDSVDRLVLSAIIDKFNGGPVGLTTIAAATQQELETVEEVVEPFLLQLGMIQRTPRGRIATPGGYAHIGKAPVISTLSL